MVQNELDDAFRAVFRQCHLLISQNYVLFANYFCRSFNISKVDFLLEVTSTMMNAKFYLTSLEKLQFKEIYDY